MAGAPESSAMVSHQVMENQISGGKAMGLPMLLKVDGFYVEQQWEVLETVTCGCYEGANRYKVMDRSGKVQLFAVKEKTGFCWRYCCGEHRPFTMHVNDVTGAKDQKMAVFKRPYHCCQWAVIPCCLPTVHAHYTVDETGRTIGTSHDTLIATMRTPWCGGCFSPTYDVYDRDNAYQARITGPFCCICDFCGADFSIENAAGNHIGTLKKLGAKTARDVVTELNTDADTFRVEFPIELGPEIKLGILATLFHIDFSFFEDERSPRECKCCDIYCCGVPMACCPKYCACCCYATKQAREKAKKDKLRANKGAPQNGEMDR